jgi:hypothetical protein
MTQLRIFDNRPQTATLRVRWRGADPTPGEYFRSEGPRTRTAYRIVSVTRAKGLAMLDGLHHLRIECRRVMPAEIPAGAIVHPWKWDSRGPRAATLKGWANASPPTAAS